MSEENNYRGRAGERQIRENQLDFLYDLYKKKIPIGDDKIDLLKKNGYIKEDPLPSLPKELESPFIDDSKLAVKTEEQQRIDAQVDILIEDEETPPQPVITDKELELRRQAGGYVFEGRETPIERSEWMPKSILDHEEEFVYWIDSINENGFFNRRPYRKFTLYVQQAYTWLQENKSYADIYDEDERQDFEVEECRRCAENSLYFLNKYVYYKEGDVKSGKVKYQATPVHEFMAYLNDCGYSMGIAKGRQIAATTTFMALDVKDVVFRRNYFMKFITEDELKAEEIFEDKLKYAFSELPYFMRPNVLNERDNFFKLGEKEEKGERGGVNSTIRVVAPKRTAIAGGAPQKVKIDEAGNISILGLMLNNQRPTMFWFNPDTKKLEMKRQIIWWGTGGEMEKGGKSFETEFMGLMKQWKERKFSAGMIPIFFDWTCRPGSSQALYDAEKAVAYSIPGEEGKRKITEFHQSWPTSLADVFRTSAKTLIDDEIIEQHLRRIREKKFESGHMLYQRGYFEPIFDTNKPIENENSDVPYKIIGANFIPTEDIDPRASATIFMHPKEGWKNRYFAGTDPIDTDTGLSNMATAIWDKYFKTFAAIVDYRTNDVKQTFMQSMLLTLYYDIPKEQGPHVIKGIKELVESNRGTSYTQYKDNKGFSDEMTINFELPPYLQNQSTVNENVGIDNKGMRNISIIARMDELMRHYGNNFYLPVIFEQLKTFVCTISEKASKETWGPQNRKYFKDDVLFACTFAYICGELCYPELIPQDLSQQSKKKVVITYETTYDDQYNLVRVPVRKMV